MRAGSRTSCVSLLVLVVALLSPGLARAALPAGQIETYTLPTANATPSSITAGPDGNLWFNESSANQIGKITTGGMITEFPAPGARPYAISAGPSGDDRLWFTDANNDEIGASTTAGSITKYSIPPVQNEAPVPEAITAGPDSALWFIETNGEADTIERIPTTATTTTPGITDFPVPTADAFATGITTGPDGNLWFTEQIGNNIGKLTPGGSFTEYPNTGSYPSAITSGPDGALWFTESGAIGEITTAGVIHQFPLPSPTGGMGGANPTATIAAGPDGNLWFAATGSEPGAEWIGRMTPTGTVTYYAVSGPALTGPNVGGITAGPDGNMWFTEEDGNDIGEIGTASGAPLVSLSPPSGLDFGNSTLGQTTAARTVTVTNTGTAPLVLGTAQIMPTGTPFATTADQCSGQTVAPGDTCTIGVTFSPASAGSYSASLQFSDNAGDSPQSLPVSGSSEPVFSSSGVDFGSIAIGLSAGPSNVTIENTGEAPLDVTGVQVVGAQAPAFAVPSDGCSGQSVSPGDSCKVGILFSPELAGSNTASLSVTDNASDSPQAVALSGIGLAPTANVAPPSIDFGPVTVDQSSAPQTVTVGNPGPGPLTISTVRVTGAQDGNFRTSADTCSGATVASDSSCSVAVTFSPTASGTDSASLQITDDAADSPQSVPLSGATPVAPSFTADSPPLTAPVGSSVGYTFSATGAPAPTYALASGAPAWLSIDPNTGELGGTVPPGTTTFTYSVTATNSVGSVSAGPFTVSVTGVAVSGTVVDGSGNPIVGAIVDGCSTSAASICGNTTTTSTGAFTLNVATGAGTSVTLTAWPPVDPTSGVQGWPTVEAPIPVPAGGLPIQGEMITILIAGQANEPMSLDLDPSSTGPFRLGWSSSIRAEVSGCPDGLGAITSTGQVIFSGGYASGVAIMPETPEGSGDYVGYVPPQAPADGFFDIQTAVTCPPLSALAPSMGPSSGGNTVIVTGSGFTDATGVDFGPAAAESYTVLSDDAIQAVAPPGTGTVPVTVYGGSTPAGGSVIDQYTYVAVQSVAPASGPAAGGTWVVITGTGLRSATSVLFGQTAAQFIQLSGTQIEALSPPGAGTQDITVDTLYGGDTPATTADQFTYDGGANATHADADAAGRQPPAGPAGSDRPLRPARVKLELPVAASAPVRPTAFSGAAAAGGPLSRAFPSSSALAVPDAGAGGLAAGVLQWVFDNGPNLLTGLSAVQPVLSSKLASLQGTCEGSEAAVSTILAAAVSPLVSAAVRAALPTALALETAYFAAAGPGLVVIYAVTPIALNALANWITQRLIEAAVKAAFGPCMKPKTPPPPSPGPGGGGDGGGGYDGGTCSDGCYFAPDALIDPSGNVLDTNGNPVTGATATILRSDTSDGPFAPVDITAPGVEPQVNPETTDADGAFHWDVDAGFYEVQVTAPGCTAAGDPEQATTTVGPYPVPPPQVGLAVTLACADEPPAPVPAVQSISERTGPAAGGTEVMVLGSGFTPSSVVRFGASEVQDVTYLSPQALTAASPPGNGVVDVVVQTAGGTSAIAPADQFFYGSPPTVTGLSVQDGPAAGGTRVTVTGTGFTGATAVGFGGPPGSSLRVDSDTELQVTAPAEPAGTIDVEVVTPAGGSPATPADRYTFVSPAPPPPTPPSPPPPSSTAPANTGAPAITGAPDVGSTLTCSTGAWSGTIPVTYSYQWLRDGVPTSGASGSSYTAVAADAGHSISCAVTATNSAGSSTARSAALTIVTTPPCSGLKGSALTACQAKVAYKAALAKCSTIKTRTRSGRKRKAACVAAAKRNYQHALALARCRGIRNSHKRAVCISRGGKEQDVPHRVADRRSRLGAGDPFEWGTAAADGPDGPVSDQPKATATATSLSREKSDWDTTTIGNPTSAYVQNRPP